MLTALGWTAALVLLAVAASSGWHALQGRTWGPLAGSGLYAGGAVITLAIGGALTAASTAVLAILCLAVAAIAAVAQDRADSAAASPDGLPDGLSWRSVLGIMLGYAGYGLRAARQDAGRLRERRAARPGAAGKAPQEGSPAAVAAEAAQARGIPSVMEDPRLGPAPEPADLASAAPVPPPYAALAQYIAQFEPEDDQALRMFMEGHAAGSVAIADAWHAFADTALNGVGLDPAYVAGILEAGDSAGEHASLLSQVHKRFHVIYSAVKEWIGAHGPLPKNARDFLTGS